MFNNLFNEMHYNDEIMYVLSFGDGFSSFGLEGLMNRSAAPTSTIAITKCSKPLFHHQFCVVVGQNVVWFLHLASGTENNIE